MFWWTVLAIIIMVASVCISGYLTTLLLSDKGYKDYYWIGYVFGIVGLIWSIGMPDLKKRKLLNDIKNELESIKITTD